MGRLSIYLPDDLEARTKALHPDTPTSQVVRSALERYIGNADEPAYAQAPDDVSELLTAGVEHFKKLATTDYQDGYRAALKRLPDLAWDALAEFAHKGFDLHKWLDEVSSRVNYGATIGELDEHTPDWFRRLADDVGLLANPLSFDQWNFRRTQPWERGYADGLRAGYEAALAAGVMTASAFTPPSTTDEPATNAADGSGEDAEPDTDTPW